MYVYINLLNNLVINIFYFQKVFEINDKFGIECKTQTGEWGPGPICIEVSSIPK